MKGFSAYALAAYPRKSQPKKFFVDQRKHPLDGHETTDLNKARIWNEPSGPYQFLIRNPALKPLFFVLPVDVPARAVSSAEKRALRRPLGRPAPLRRLKHAHA